LFLLRPAGGIGIRACLRSTIFRVRIPGGVPDFFVREQSALACSFTTWMWQTTPRRACSEPIGRAAGRRVPVISSRCSAAGQRASFGTTRPQVRVLPARPYPCSSLVVQWHEEHDATNVADGSSILSKGSIQDAVTQSAECSLVEREVAGSSPAGVASLHGA
jgi:hypothetical protein